MSRRVVAVALVAAVLTPASWAGAVTRGTLDGNGHPWVVMLAFYATEDGVADTYQHRCSGTLLAPKVVLTAAHCTAGMERAWATNAASVTEPFRSGIPTGSGAPGTPHTHPLYDDFASFPDTHDIGVVVLDSPLDTGGTFGRLPSEGLLDPYVRAPSNRSEVLFTTVGYGLQQVRPRLQAQTVRYAATSHLVNLESAINTGGNLQTSNNAGKHDGGSCFGDSGGPVFWGDTATVAGVVSFGVSPNCTGTDWSRRADIADTLNFVRPFLGS